MGAPGVGAPISCLKSRRRPLPYDAGGRAGFESSARVFDPKPFLLLKSHLLDYFRYPNFTGLVPPEARYFHLGTCLEFCLISFTSRENTESTRTQCSAGSGE
jgi:hypothetical protein